MLTSAQGRVIARYSYQPFGGLLKRSGTASTDIQFTGQWHDNDTGLVEMGAREYDPVRARFISPDTIIPEIDTQAANRYLYAYGNPLSWTDPSGHQPCNPCNFSEGAAITVRIEGPPNPIGAMPGGPPQVSAPETNRIAEAVTRHQAFEEVAGAPLSLTGLRLGNITRPRPGGYANPVAADWVGKGIISGVGYLKFAELLEAGHVCAAATSPTHSVTSPPMQSWIWAVIATSLWG